MKSIRQDTYADNFIYNAPLTRKLQGLFLEGIKSKGFSTREMHERDWDLIEEMERSGLVECDWTKMESQTHREVGYRYLNCKFDCQKITAILNRVNGTFSRISPTILQKLGKDFEENISLDFIRNVVMQYPLSRIMFDYTETGNLFYIFCVLSSSEKEKDFKDLLEILSSLLNELSLSKTFDRGLPFIYQFEEYFESFQRDIKITTDDFIKIQNILFPKLVDGKIKKPLSKLFGFDKNTQQLSFQGKIIPIEKRGGKITKYCDVLIKIIENFPDNTKEVRIPEFEKMVGNKKKAKLIGDFRGTIGSSGHSFKNYLKKNKIKNENPKNKGKIIWATDDYIFFNNSL